MHELLKDRTYLGKKLFFNFWLPIFLHPKVVTDVKNSLYEGQVERAYEHLKLICQKIRNQNPLEVARLKNLFFLAVLKLEVKDFFG